MTRIRREAQAMGRLGDHPHIVTAFDIGDEAGQPYIVSQYMAGGDLAAHAAAAPNHRLPIDDVLRIGREICMALEHAHERGVIHRDLKPGNLWLAADATVLLGDFGLAMATDRSRVTQEGMMLGTVAYMPPEQALARPLDARSDLYALGAVLYELVTGRPPFLGDDVVGVISQHINTAPVAPSWFNAEVPRGVEALILKLLAKDPGQRPESATRVREEIERIQASSAERSVAAVPATPQATATEGVNWDLFFGRQAEMDQLKGALDQALSGRGSLAMVVGEPGIGKTRLVEEFGVYSTLRGAQVLTGRCYEGEAAVPYLPFVEAFRKYARGRGDEELRAALGDGAPEVATLISEVRQRFPDLPEAPPVESEAERLRLFASVAGFLENASNAQPLVLFLDDIHWGDKPSLLLMQYLARRVTSSRVLILAAYRDVELDRTHALAEVLATLRRERSYERVLLRGLSERDILKWLTVANPDTAEEPGAGLLAFAAALYQETEGNPFFIREVLQHLIEEGKLYREDGRWTSNATSVSDLGIPEGVREVVGRRLSRLSDGCNRMLTLASTLTSGFSWEALQAVSDEDEATLLELLEEALRAQVIRERKEERSGSYDFTHALIRQTLYGELSTPRRVILHRRIGEALERLYGSHPEAHLDELAHHFYQAAPGGDVEKALGYAMRAGERAVALLAYEEAMGHFERALQVLEMREPADESRRFELLHALGHACLRADLNEKAIASMEEAARIAERTGDAAQLARAAIGYQLAMGRGDNVGQRKELPVIERALAAQPPGDSSERAGLLVARILAMGFRATDEERKQLAEDSREAKEMAERVGDRDAHCGALTALHHAHFGPEHTEKRLEIGLEWRRAAEGTNDPRQRHIANLFRISDLMELGDVASAEREIPAAADLADSLREPLNACNRPAWSAMLCAMRGRYAEAEQHAMELARLVQRAQHPFWRASLAAQFYDLRWGQGRLAEMEQAIVDLLESYRQTGARQAIPATLAGLACLYVETERPDRAREAYEELARDDFACVSRDFNLLVTMLLASYIARRLRDTQRAQTLYEILRPYAGRNIVVGYAVLVDGSASFPLGMLAATLGRFDEAEGHLEDAIGFNRRIGARPWLARAQIEYADVLRERDGSGDRAKALALANEAVRSFDELGMQLELKRGLAMRLELQGVRSSDTQASIDLVTSTVGHRPPDLTSHVAPDGTVTLMFSDMEGFTRMTESLGDLKAREVIRAHNAIVREQLAAHQGHEVELQGDGFLLAFGSARRAVLCAIALQRAFEAYSREHAEQPIRVRIGLHTGEALKDAEKFFGKSVILASRIAAQATAGEILVSSLLKQLTESTGDLRFGGEREVPLKGISEPQRVHTVEWQ
jgi:class 3 adenylate cyclase